MMRLPDFLIIGAMKAGTTSLYRDLYYNPAIFLPHVKEPGNLGREEVLTEAGRQAYAKHFVRAKAHQLCGEASTDYTKLPGHPGVPQRAKRVLGAQMKVIYLVREPVPRIVSQHHHEFSWGHLTCGIDEAVRKYPRYINFSRYAMQITPWLETLGPQQVLIVHFETYINDRRGTVAEVSRFLGIEPCCDRIQAERVYNRSEGKPVSRGPWRRLREATVYQSVVRPMLPPSIKEKIRFILFPKAPRRPDPPSVETVQYIIEQVRDDAEQLRVLMGRNDPLWDFQAALRHGEEQKASQP